MKAAIVAIHFVAVCFSVCAAERPHLRDVIAVPKFEKRGNATHLIIENGKEPIDILWSVELRRDDPGKSYQYFPVTLAPGARYTFTIEEQQYPLLKELEEFGMAIPDAIGRKELISTRQTLVRISREGEVIFDREVCEIHDRKMQRIDAPIIYGLIMHSGPQPTLEETQIHFPHYREVSFGGCVVMPEKTTLMFVCTDCKAAHEKWEKNQRRTTK